MAGFMDLMRKRKEQMGTAQLGGLAKGLGQAPQGMGQERGNAYGMGQALRGQDANMGQYQTQRPEAQAMRYQQERQQGGLGLGQVGADVMERGFIPQQRAQNWDERLDRRMARRDEMGRPEISREELGMRIQARDQRRGASVYDQMRQRAQQGAQRPRNTQAGMYRRMMMEAARKRYSRANRQGGRRQRFNPYIR